MLPFLPLGFLAEAVFFSLPWGNVLCLSVISFSP